MILIGICSAFFGSLVGAGGGFLNVPLLILLGYPENSTAISLVAVLANGITSSIFNIRKELVDFKIVSFFIPFAIVGGLFGAFVFDLVKSININIFKLIFTFFLIVLGVRIFFKKYSKNDEIKVVKVEQLDKKYIIYAILLGFTIGFLGSFLGIGGGIITVPTFILLFEVSTHVAIASSLFLMIFNSISGLITYTMQGNLILELGIFLAIGAVIGANIGPRVTYRLKSESIRKIYGIIMVFFAIPLIWLRMFFFVSDPIQDCISNITSFISSLIP